MATRKAVIGFLLLLLIVTIPQTSAENSQGLYWGVEEDTKIDYHYSRTGIPGDDFDFYVTVESLPELPELVNTRPPYPSLSYYFVNDTPIENNTFAYLSVSIVPIGNWTHFAEIVEQYYFENPYWGQYQFEIIEDFSVWGYRLTNSAGYEGIVYFSHQREFVISKTDGVMINFTDTTTDYTRIIPRVISSFQITRSATEASTTTTSTTTSGDETDLVFIFVGVGGIGVVVVVLIIIRYRKGSMTNL